MVKDFISRNFSFILLLSMVIGLFIPSPGEISSFLILGLLFIVIFCSFFQFDFDKEEIIRNSKVGVIFSIGRYVVLPFLLYYILVPFSEFYAFGAFFVSLMPAGVSSPAVTGILKGNFNLSVLICISSSILVVITVPVFVPVFMMGDKDIQGLILLKTLFFTILLPFFLHLLFRPIQSVKNRIAKNLPVIVVICLSIILMIASAKNKTEILNNPFQLIDFIIFSFLVLSMLYLVGFTMIYNTSLKNKITNSISSGLNNMGLAVSLAILFLPHKFAVMYIVSELAWVSLLIPVKCFMRKKPRYL
ncbi:MAG: bile acid:sodium symporter family protein [bacterium]